MNGAEGQPRPSRFGFILKARIPVNVSVALWPCMDKHITSMHSYVNIFLHACIYTLAYVHSYLPDYLPTYATLPILTLPCRTLPHLHAYIDAHIHACACRHAPTYIHVYTQTHTRTYILTCLLTYIHGCVHGCMPTCMRACMDALLAHRHGQERIHGTLAHIYISANARTQM